MKFKESPLVKNHKILTGTKRDMRKKVVKSTTPTSDLKKPTTLKRQLGGNIFTTYNSIAPYEGPVFEQPVATVEIKELPVNRLETNRQSVMAKAEEKKEEPVVEEKVSTEPLPTSKEETPVVENKESTPINIKSKDEFIKTMTPAFENALKAKGLDTKYAKYLVAQSALESNWGKSQSGKFNFGGIKGKGTIRKTREVINGKSIHINDSFRDFKDINDYANYHVSLLNNKRYQAFSGGDFIDRVVKGGYATDPNYKRALSNVYNQIAKAQEGMKIPKLKGAGELRNRILRQFNKEKAANRNEEQLIGFDWSRYKSNKPKPETTPTEPTQSEQLENGGVIKAQDGIVTQAINKVKSFLPKEEPKEPINVVDVAKEYAPSFAASLLTRNVRPIISQLFKGNGNEDVKQTSSKVDWSTLSSKYRRPVDIESMKYIENWANSNLPKHQRDALLGTILEESGGNPEALSPDSNFYGLLQWENRRYPISNDKILSKRDKLNKQLEYIKNTLTNYSDSSSWTDGGKGSGYQSKKDAINRFNNSSLPLDSTVHALNFGYVRPAGKHNSVRNRLEASKLIQANKR